MGSYARSSARGRPKGEPTAVDLAVQAKSPMGIQLTAATFATVAPFFEAFEPLRRGEGASRFTNLEALMDMVVGGEACRVWAATVDSLETGRECRGCALVVGPRFPGDQEPTTFELTALPADGYGVSGSIEGWAGLIRETERDSGMSAR